MMVYSEALYSEMFEQRRRFWSVRIKQRAKLGDRERLVGSGLFIIIIIKTNVQMIGSCKYPDFDP